jgi:hypothetical protein
MLKMQPRVLESMGNLNQASDGDGADILLFLFYDGFKTSQINGDTISSCAGPRSRRAAAIGRARLYSLFIKGNEMLFDLFRPLDPLPTVLGPAVIIKRNGLE